MKFKFFLLSLLILGVYSCGSNGAGDIEEGIITYKIDYPEIKDNFFLYHVLPKELKASIKDNKMELKIKKASLENTVIVDGRSKKIAAYYNYGDVFSTLLTDQDVQLLVSKQPDYQVKITNIKDTLAGFNVRKALVSDPNFPGKTMEVWYTEDIKFKNPNWFNGFQKIPGIMLKYSIIQYGLRMDFVATKFEDVTISDSVVSMQRPGKQIPHSLYDKKIIDLFDSFK